MQNPLSNTQELPNSQARAKQCMGSEPGPSLKKGTFLKKKKEEMKRS